MTIKLISSTPEKREANSNSRPQIFENLKNRNRKSVELQARCRKFLKSLSDDDYQETHVLDAMLTELEGNAVASKSIDDFKWRAYRIYRHWKNYSPPS